MIVTLQTRTYPITRRGRVLAGVLAAVLLLTAAAVEAGGDKKGAKGTPGVARCVSVSGSLVQRDGKGWQVLKAKDPIAADALVIALPKAEVLSDNGKVELALLADIGQRGFLPVLESAVALHKSKDADLELTFTRGLIVLTNRAKKGSAKVRLRFGKEVWLLTLQQPGARVGLELYSRCPPGLPKIVDGKFAGPTTDVFLLTLEGSVFLEVGIQGMRLTAPPGPAMVHWDSLHRETEVRRLEELPVFAKPLPAKEKKIFEAIVKSAGRLGTKPLAALADLLKSGERVDRLFGVTVAGALDDLPHVIAALEDPKHADLRDHTVLVLRNWMGRELGNAKALYAALQKQPGYNDVRARTVMQLLFGFNDEDRGRPETYEMLIGYLMHNHLPVRELARWHLVRLAPAGKDIVYDAAAPEAERQKGHAQWQTLIPAGKLPPAPKVTPKK